MPWMRVNKAAEYADVSPRTVRRWFKEGLRHSRVNGIPYVSDAALDDFMNRHEVDENAVQRIVDEVTRCLTD